MGRGVLRLCVLMASLATAAGCSSSSQGPDRALEGIPYQGGSPDAAPSPGPDGGVDGARADAAEFDAATQDGSAGETGSDASPPTPQGFVRRAGKDIVDGNGEHLNLRGFGLGGWLVPEGYMWGANAPVDSPTRIHDAIVDLVGDTHADEFFHRYEANYVAEQDIEQIAALRVNSVRLPMTWKKLIDESGNPKPEGFAQVDQLVSWCKQHGLYVVLDLHCAPGGQSAYNIADADGVARLWTEPGTYWPLTTRLWELIAERYADEPSVLGYDLINEPVLPDGHGNEELRALLVEVTQAIRAIDTHHLLFAEGNWYASDFSQLDDPWDDNMAYSFHLYEWSGATPEPSWIDKYVQLRETTDRPLWLGETGENSEAWVELFLRILENRNIGWSVWSHKKMDTGSSPWSSPRQPGFQAIVDYWNAGGQKPDSSTATQALLEQADFLALDRCERRDGWIGAVTNQIPRQRQWDIPGTVEAEGYRNMTGIWVGESAGVTRVGYTDDGDWVEYALNVPSAGDYSLDLRLATDDAAGQLQLSVNGVVASVLGVPDTGGWTSYQVVSAGKVPLNAGEQRLRVAFVGGAGGVADIDWLRLGP